MHTCIKKLAELGSGELAGSVRTITWNDKKRAKADDIDKGPFGSELFDKVMGHEECALDINFLFVR